MKDLTSRQREIIGSIQDIRQAHPDLTLEEALTKGGFSKSSYYAATQLGKKLGMVIPTFRSGTTTKRTYKKRKPVVMQTMEIPESVATKAFIVVVPMGSLNSALTELMGEA